MNRQVFLLFAFAAIAIASPFPDREARIIGGSNAPLGRFPYQVSIRATMDSRHICAGSIINNRWVLTVAQCTFNVTPTAIRLIVGSVLLNSGGSYHYSSKIVNHPNFDQYTFENDVSVIQTKTVMVFYENVRPIALGSVHVGGDINAFFTGWGNSISWDSSLTNHLQQLETRTLNTDDCRDRKIDPEVNIGNLKVFDSKICTFTRRGEGGCLGDAGGALAAGTSLIGIYSWGTCAYGYPDVHERVSHWRSWILETIA